jgi:hypothetical protein
LTGCCSALPLCLLHSNRRKTAGTAVRSRQA